MADLEAMLAHVSYLMAMEKSKATPAARASKRIVLPEPNATTACSHRFLEMDVLVKSVLDLESAEAEHREMRQIESLIELSEYPE
ncbi:hypothetical protein P7K49_035986, partial [Saguinus oedipus]